MKPYVTLTAAAALWASTGLGHAATLAGSLLPTSFNSSSSAACYIRNVGPNAIALEVQIVESDGSAFPPSFQNCNAAPLVPGKTCVVLVNVPAGFAVACSAKAVGSVRNLRGTLEIRDPANDLKVLLADDLR